MVSSVMSRPNHYEVLGLAPTANEGEIARAFASRMSLFGSHAPGDAARICAAYEILRDAGRRRDYDRSIGLRRKPEPREWAFAVTQASWPGFVGSAAATKPTEQRRRLPPRSRSSRLRKANRRRRSSVHPPSRPRCADWRSPPRSTLPSYRKHSRSRSRSRS